MTRHKTPKLFAVYLGGRAPRCNTELHDVVFAVSATIEETYEQLLDLWFGEPQRLHVDSYMELDVVDGHRVRLVAEPYGERALYFINLGGYVDGLFTELHANTIVVAGDAREAKARGKRDLMRNGERQAHADDLYDVDDCLEVSRVGRFHVGLEPVSAAGWIRRGRSTASTSFPGPSSRTIWRGIPSARPLHDDGGWST